MEHSEKHSTFDRVGPSGKEISYVALITENSQPSSTSGLSDISHVLICSAQHILNWLSQIMPYNLIIVRTLWV